LCPLFLNSCCREGLLEFPDSLASRLFLQFVLGKLRQVCYDAARDWATHPVPAAQSASRKASRLI
jgi:hypothetical protein